MDKTLADARAYHDLGMAILWLRPRSKRPIEFGWTQGKRLEWKELEEKYRSGMNVGVRLGQASQIAGKFLACLDVDVRDRQWKKVAEETLDLALRELGAPGKLPEVMSGSGGDSRHLYFLTSKPFRQTVFGERKKCWGVVGYSEGRQMVLPPSIHPETGKRYRWTTELDFLGGGLPLLQVPAARESLLKEGAPREIVDNWQADASARMLVCELPPKMRELIETGNTDDRSAALVPAARALMSVGATEKEILSVLSDPTFGLSQCAYDHVQSGDRKRAVDWLWKYTVERLWREHRRPPEAFKKVERDQPAPEVPWQDSLHRTRDGQVKCDVHNVILLIENEIGEKLFRKNEFSSQIFHGRTSMLGKPGKLLTDEDINSIGVWLSQKWDLSVPGTLVWSAVTEIAKLNAFHPVRNYLNSLTWDGTARIDTWLRDYVGSDMPEPYLTEVSRKFLLAAVARIQEPGIKFDHMVVLEGSQGIGKSTVPAILASPGWFLAGLPNIRDKDALIALQGTWFIEISELASLRGVDSESYKAFFSASIDRFRQPYGRASGEFPRQCVFMGTTNLEDYLSDTTGNRRFWPVKVRGLEFRRFKRDRDQLWAEAKVLWDTFREDLYLKGVAHQQALEIQESRVALSEELVMREQFAQFLDKQAGLPEVDRFDLSSFRLEDLFGGEGGFPILNPKNWQLQLAGRVLVHQGYERYTVHGRSRWRPIPPSETI